MQATPTPSEAPPCGEYRLPTGPCEDIGQCPLCLSPIGVLRPAGETFGFHERDCSLPVVHPGECEGGGSGHEPQKIRGWWPGFEADVQAEREWWASRATP